MKDLEKLLNKVIFRGFLELANQDIQIEWVKDSDSIMALGELTSEGWYIEVDSELANSSEEVLVGGISHELCHIIQSLKLSKKQRVLEKLTYKFSKAYKTLLERDTDLECLLRGFGPELLAFLEESKRLGYDHFKEDGLSIREIERLIRKP